MHETRLRRPLTMLLTWVMTISLLSACEKKTVDVNLHGVNYSGDTFTYVVSDPAKTEEGSGGELIDPFGAGGMTCCVTLPKVWRPGIKLKVRATHWLKERPDGSLPEIKGEHIVDVPAYVDGKPGDLWVLREADGKVSVVSSDFQPNHPKWPGKVKGWPVPSPEYQHERWEILRRHQQKYVDLYLEFLDELGRAPKSRSQKAWAYAMEHEPETLRNFSGFADPRYLAYLKGRYELGLAESRAELSKVMEIKP
ncbi:DUF3304 domain-containing protein [Massilia sp. GCM10023247]|uniref:DUF3304 domain-containing protein n=1 Tax=Massilia sp. GCM10023247 TaxID=3252643 RepID=UPI00360FEE0D